MRANGTTCLIGLSWLILGVGCGSPGGQGGAVEAGGEALHRGHDGHAGQEGHSGHRIKDVDAYIARLEGEERARWQKPDEVMAALALGPGERVADIGAGSGYFTIRMAKAVGADGVVWAVDVEQEMLDHIEKRATSDGVGNIRLHLVAGDDPALPPGQIDTILIVNTYHHFPDRSAYVRKLRAALAPGGRIVNIDFTPKPREERGFGPSLDRQLARETVHAEMAQAGLKPVSAHDFLPEQYFVEYRVE